MDQTTNQNTELKGKRALVMGGASGIGKATSARMAWAWRPRERICVTTCSASSLLLQ